VLSFPSRSQKARFSTHHSLQSLFFFLDSRSAATMTRASRPPRFLSNFLLFPPWQRVSPLSLCASFGWLEVIISLYYCMAVGAILLCPADRILSPFCGFFSVRNIPVCALAFPPPSCPLNPSTSFSQRENPFLKAASFLLDC